MQFISQNPATEEILATVETFSAQEVEKKLTASAKAFAAWKQTPFAERKKLMKALAKLLLKEKKRLGTIITQEMGKPITQAIGEIEKCAWACSYFADNAETFLRNESMQTDVLKGYVRFDPLGSILAVMPWNFPFWQVFRAAAPALMAGNTMLLKHASNVSLCALEIEKLFLQAGFPKGVFITLLLQSTDVAKLIADDRIAAVTLTGSEGAGRSVAEAAGHHIKKSVLELGGSDPFLILSDADLEKAVQAAVTARTINTGQSCIAAKRFIVEKTIAKAFTQRFVEEMNHLVVGDPMDPKTQVGPMSRKDLVKQLDQQVQKSVKQGAKVLLGGQPIKGKGYFYPPTVLSNIKKGMPTYDEELFGPVASIFVAKDENEMVRLANDTRFGLGANLWTKDLKKAEALAKQLDAGFVAVNDFVKSDPRLPFGGVKKSGYGRELSTYGIKEFVNIKTVVLTK